MCVCVWRYFVTYSGRFQFQKCDWGIIKELSQIGPMPVRLVKSMTLIAVITRGTRPGCDSWKHLKFNLRPSD